MHRAHKGKKMSFERFSSSDIYMFEHVSGFIECCGCWLIDWDTEGFPQLKTPREALSHLDIHEAAGHDIGKARVRIQEEYPDLDIEIRPYKEDPEKLKEIKQKLKAFFTQPHPPKQFRDKSNGE